MKGQLEQAYVFLFKPQLYQPLQVPDSAQLLIQDACVILHLALLQLFRQISP